MLLKPQKECALFARRICFALNVWHSLMTVPGANQRYWRSWLKRNFYPAIENQFDTLGSRGLQPQNAQGKIMNVPAAKENMRRLVASYENAEIEGEVFEEIDGLMNPSESNRLKRWIVDG